MVTAEKNPEYDTDPGNDTKDKVFLLSLSEADQFFADNADGMCVPTPYAKDNGVLTDETYTLDGEELCWWWLRSPGKQWNLAAIVNNEGLPDYTGEGVGFSDSAVRPALWVELED